MYPSGTGSSLSILIDDWSLHFFCSMVSSSVCPPMGLDLFKLLWSGRWERGEWDFIGSNTELGDWSLATAAATDEASPGNLWKGFGIPGISRLLGKKWDTPGGRMSGLWLLSDTGIPPGPETLIGGYLIMPNGDPWNPGGKENGDALPGFESGELDDNAGGEGLGEWEDVAGDDLLFDEGAFGWDSLSSCIDLDMESERLKEIGSLGRPSLRRAARLLVEFVEGPSGPSCERCLLRCCSNFSLSVKP